MRMLFAATLAGTFLGASAAGAITQSFTGSVGPTSLGFGATSVVPAISQFNPALGNLTGINVHFDGLLEGFDHLESLDSQPSTVTSNYSSIVTLLRNVTVLGSVTPLQIFTDQFSAYDGSNNSGGTSGASHDGLSISSSFDLTPSDSSPYVGTGTVPFSVSASVNNSISGTPSFTSSILNNETGTVTVTYTYDLIPAMVPVPEPVSMALLGAGLAGLLMIRRTRA